MKGPPLASTTNQNPATSICRHIAIETTRQTQDLPCAGPRSTSTPRPRAGLRRQILLCATSFLPPVRCAMVPGRAGGTCPSPQNRVEPQAALRPSTVRDALRTLERLRTNGSGPCHPAWPCGITRCKTAQPPPNVSLCVGKYAPSVRSGATDSLFGALADRQLSGHEERLKQIPRRGHVTYRHQLPSGVHG